MRLGSLRTALRLVWSADPPGALLAVGGSFAIGAVPVVTAWIAKLVVDELAAGDRSRGFFTLIVAGLAATLLVGQVGIAWLGYVEEQLSRRIEVTVQGELFGALNRFPGVAVFERPSFHDHLQLAQQAGQTAPYQLVSVAAGMVQGTVSLVGFAGVLLTVGPVLVVLAALAVVPQVIAELRLSRRRVDLHRGLSPALRRTLFYSRLQSEPEAATELRLFDLGAFFHRRMLDELRTIFRSERALARRVLAIQAALGALSAAATGTGIVLVVGMAAAGQVTPGDVVVVLSALPGTAAAVTGLVRQLAQGAEALLLVGHYQDLVERAPAGTAGSERRRCLPLRDGITLDNIWFRYDDDLPWVLRGVSLHIPHGRSLGLVGLNGAGKTTLVKLITQLYEPTRGRVLWDGVDLRELDPASVRHRIGAVFQDFMTYDLTAAENIGLGDLAYLNDLDRVRHVAERAGVHQMIERFPRGYRTMLSRTHGSHDDDQTGGMMPSGGQWQRLALARMLMRAGRDLLILDEPSSGLDAQAEHGVLRLVHKRTAGATRLLISHRLSSVRMADVIVVIAGGRIAEQGTHDQLIRNGSGYARLFHTQAAGYRD